MKVHLLKIQQDYFFRVLDGVKTFEVRKNDRNYSAGDLVIFINPDDDGDDDLGFTIYKITYILYDTLFPDGIKPGYCVFAIKPYATIKRIGD